MSRYDFGTSMQARLRRLKKTQRQLSASLGYSPSYISMVLSGTYAAPAVREKILTQVTQWEQERRRS